MINAAFELEYEFHRTPRCPSTLDAAILRSIMQHMDMDDDSFSRYADAWRRRFAEKKEDARAHAEDALRSLDRAISILKKYGAARIILFGSLCSGSFRPGSDIDLAVEGVPKESWTRAMADVLMALDHPVDLKPLEEVNPAFREHIVKEGRTLYAKT